MNYQNADFHISAAKLEQCPSDSEVEVAFAGRSNAGKSSALNALTNQKSLARTSRQPGRTQLINFFQLDTGKYLVDLPGYGYAKVSQSLQREWQETLGKYLTERQQLKAIVLLVDIRLGLKDFDRMMLQTAVDLQMACHILLTKSDRCKQSEKAKTLQNIKSQFSSLGNDKLSVQTFSATKKEGLETLRDKLDTFYQ